MKPLHAFSLLGVALLLSACGGDGEPTQAHGPDPKLPEPQRGLLPSMKIAQPAAWGELKPTVPEGFSVTAIATGLKIPRQSLVLPNGDILVAEGRGGSAAKLKPKDVIASQIKAKGNTQVKGGNRLTLLRDADGDGNYEVQAVFADNLNAPYGLAYANGKLYVANQDALVRFDYKEGQTQADGPPTKVTDLPAEINHHWTKALTISPDGRFLYVGIGSNSNITERGLEVEIDRAMVWQVDAETGAHRPYATGLRNPTALTIQPQTGQLWTVVKYVKGASMVGLTATGASMWMSGCGRRTRTRWRRRSSRITAWVRMWLHWVWTSRPRQWASALPTVYSWASTAAGTGPTRWATR